MTDTIRIAGGVAIPSLAMVSADQVTIIGNGTPESPLRAGVTLETFGAEFVGFVAPQLGQAVVVSLVTSPRSVVTVTPGRAGAPGTAEDVAVAQVVGVIVAIGRTVTVRTSGLVTLTQAEWTAVAAGAGEGLHPGLAYYLTANGHISFERPIAATTFVVQVGVALSPTTLLLSLPAVPVRNKDGQTFVARVLFGTPVLGQAVGIVDGTSPTTVRAASADALGLPLAVGLVVTLDAIVTVQGQGLVTLDQREWDAVTGRAGGLFPGIPYFVSTAPGQGRLTENPPTASGTFVSQVGISLDTTTMLLTLPSNPIRNP